jgi:hypothetical protein
VLAWGASLWEGHLGFFLKGESLGASGRKGPAKAGVL